MIKIDADKFKFIRSGADKRELIRQFNKFDKKEDVSDKVYLDTLNKINTGQIDSLYFAKKNVSLSKK